MESALIYESEEYIYIFLLLLITYTDIRCHGTQALIVQELLFRSPIVPV